jgi:hypothetical protein
VISGFHATDHGGENAGGVELERPSTPVASERRSPLGVHVTGYSPQVNCTVPKTVQNSFAKKMRCCPLRNIPPPHTHVLPA